MPRPQSAGRGWPEHAGLRVGACQIIRVFRDRGMSPLIGQIDVFQRYILNRKLRQSHDEGAVVRQDIRRGNVTQGDTPDRAGFCAFRGPQARTQAHKEGGRL